MKVSVNVPHTYGREHLISYLRQSSDISNKELTDHYLYLLQITSFDYNINWVATENRVEIELPYRSLRNDVRENFAEDVPLLTLNTRQDLLTSILVRIMQDVSPERIKSHYQLGKSN